jgi:hypothetical protein
LLLPQLSLLLQLLLLFELLLSLQLLLWQLLLLYWPQLVHLIMLLPQRRSVLSQRLRLRFLHWLHITDAKTLVG